MKTLLAAFACLTLAGAPAFAQTATRWTPPGGGYSLDFAASGFVQLSAAPPQFTLVVGPPERVTGEVRLCAITEATFAGETTPADIRHMADTITQEQLAGAFNGQTVDRVTHANVGGTTVADAYTTAAQATHHHKLFYVPAPGGARLVDVDCFWTPSMAAEKIAPLEGILTSVNFTPSVSP